MTRVRRGDQPTLFAPEAKTKPGVAAQMKRAADEIADMHKRGSFHGAEPIHLVAIYLELHIRVYGVEAVDLGPSERPGAIAAAASLVRTYFEGSGERAVEFVRWVWRREQDREKWRRENGRDGKRLSWRLQFSSALVADYRVALARKKSSGVER